MLQYVNSFSCHLDEAKDTLVLHFIQKEPIIPDDNDENEDIKIVTNKIASIVMDSDCALGLASSIAQLFNIGNEEDSE